MTDLTPNDLSHLTDEEFNALAPQGYHATGPAKALSPAARAVLLAASEVYWDWCNQCPADATTIASAALRAAAKQMSSHQSQKFLYSIADAMKLQDIAAELEQQGD